LRIKDFDLRDGPGRRLLLNIELRAQVAAIGASRLIILRGFDDTAQALAFTFDR
jgi:hypothetical protein